MSRRRIVGIVLFGLSLGLVVRGGDDDALTVGLAVIVGVVLP